MVIIAGCLIVRDNKILMVKEAKKKCYGQWNFPAGHVEENELITEAAIREAYEETGCKVKLTGVLPISTAILKEGKTAIIVKFTAEITDENIKEEKQNSRKQAFSKFCLGAYYYFEFGNIERNENGKLNRVLRNELRIRMECDIT